MTKTTGLNLDDLEAQVAVDEAVDFEPFMPNGEPSGIVLKVMSDQAPKVAAALLELRDGRKRQEQIIEAQQAKARPGEVFIPAAKDDAYLRKLVAARLAGWNLNDEFTPENVDRLLRRVFPSSLQQIINKSAELSSFTPALPKT